MNKRLIPLIISIVTLSQTGLFSAAQEPEVKQADQAVQELPEGVRSFYWANEGDSGLIGGMERPQADTPEALEQLGVTLVINLAGNNFIKPDLYARKNIRQYIIALPDMSPPPLNKIFEFIKEVSTELDNNHNVVTHCFAGKGRTGTMLACWLVAKKGFTPDNAIKRIRELSPGSIETKAQEEQIHTFYGFVKHLPKQ